MIRFPSTAAGFSAIAVLGVFVAATAATQAHAKVQDNCRRIAIEGAAGNSTTAATWSIYDNAPTPNRLVESCLMQAQPDETNLQYIRRLGHRWGDANADPACPAVDDTTEATNRCLVDQGGTKSCKIKTKISPKADGSKKRYVEFCCYADTGCGEKLADPIPITVFVNSSVGTESCPAAGPGEDGAVCTVDVDPIAMRNLPTGPGAACRDAIATAVNSYTAGTTAALTTCYDTKIAAGAATNCNSVTEDDATRTAVDLLAPVIDAATDVCAATTRTPRQMGYGFFPESAPTTYKCPEPCDDIELTVGGGWADAAECLRCQAQEAAIATVETIYGPTAGPGTAAAQRSVTEDARACQAAVTKAVASAALVRASETSKCQKKIDAGGVLPPHVASCKGSDAKGAIRKTEENVRADVDRDCDAVVLAELALCDGATNADSVAGCVNQAAEELNKSVATAAIPNGDKCVLCNLLAYVSTIYDKSIDAINGVQGLADGRDVTVSPDGRHIYVATYVDGQISVFSRDALTGEATWVEAKPAAANSDTALFRAHSVIVSPDGKHVYTGNDYFDYSAVSLFDRNAVTGQLTFVAVYRQTDFWGIKQVLVSPDGANVYAMAYGGYNNTPPYPPLLGRLVVFSRNPTTGVLTPVQTVVDGQNGVDGIANSLDMAISPDGAQVYVTGVNDNAVAIFSRDAGTGQLTFVQAMYDNVDAPYLARADGVAVSHDGRFVYVNSFDEDVNVFRRDALTGLLTFVERFPAFGGPGKIVVSSDNGRIYVSTWDSVVEVFGRNLVSDKHVALETERNGVNGVTGISGVQGIAVSPDGRDVYTGSAAHNPNPPDDLRRPGLTHFRSRCGNGVIETDEGCDDGNGASGDGCAGDCTVE